MYKIVDVDTYVDVTVDVNVEDDVCVDVYVDVHVGATWFWSFSSGPWRC